ncbi:MAG: carnitine dehydratase [Rhodospirillales bacterium RIFCSPLOWO2_12_FULL_67_15]|nr:MAG: carnitine dehydratase [Rhodospirillales bacterium RIFCSPLOWO2_12_FULL_67_15]
MGALDGILVVALEQAVAAPYTSSRLADAGARVIKIERPEGDFARGYDRAAKGQSSYFVWLNRGKESLVLDIKRDDDKALLGRIVARADVFIQNLAPGAAARAGFGAGDLRRAHPRLIVCDISGYGEDNSYRDMRAYDMLVQAESGLASVTGGPDRPSRVGVSVCDIAAGMYAHAAILEALIRRGRTGEGETVKISLFDGMADWMAVPLLHHDYGGAAPARVGLRHPSIVPYESFATADGGRIVISIQNEREWARFAKRILRRPEWAKEGPFADNVARVKNRAQLLPAIAQVFAGETREGMAQKLKTAEIAYGFVNSVAEFSRHPALRRAETPTPMGAVAVPAPPARRPDTETLLRPVPALGEHSAAIRREFAP